MSVDRRRPAGARVTRRGRLGQGRPRGLRRRRRGRGAANGSPSPTTAAGLKRHGPPGCSRAGVAEVGIERPDGPVVDALLAGRADRARHPARPGQEPARPRTGRPATRTTGSTPTCWPTWSAPTGAGCGRWTATREPTTAAAHRPCGPAGTWSTTGSRRPTSSAPTCRSCSPPPSALFADIDSDDQPARSWTGSPPRTRPTGSRPKRLGAWLASVGYSGRTDPAVLHARLLAAPRGTTGPHAAAHAEITLALRRRPAGPEHPDPGPRRPASPTSSPPTPTRRSSPRCPAPAPSAPPGCSPRSATPAAASPPADSLTCLAGVAPSTRQSGKVKAVTFRWGADKQLRDALCDFAGDSRHANPWAADLYDQGRARGHDHPHAVRILARAWAHIIWRCWQDHVPYDPAAHNSLQTLLKQHQPAAA